MTTLATRPAAVKPTSRVLFDATQPRRIARQTFGLGVLPISLYRKAPDHAAARRDNLASLAALGLDANDAARIDAVRHDAFVEALAVTSEADAEEAAGDAAAAEYSRLVAEKAARRIANREKPARRMPYTADDAAWWAAQNGEIDAGRDWDNEAAVADALDDLIACCGF